MFAFVRAHHRVLKKYASEVKGVCLDVGSGDRLFESFFRGTYSRYVAVDYLPSENGRVGEGRRRGRDFVQPDLVADGMALPIESSSIDTVLLIEVLEHIPDPRLLLGEAIRGIKPRVRLLLKRIFLPDAEALRSHFDQYSQFTLRHLATVSGLL